MPARSWSRRLRALACALLPAIVSWLAGCGPAPGGVSAIERRSVELTLLVDGSLQVRETLRVRFAGPPPGAFRWRVSGDRVDSFFDTAAWLDGVPLDDDPADEARVRVERDGDLDVEWRVPATTDVVRELVLEYRAGGATAVRGANAILEWSVAPIVPKYPVLATAVSLTVPRRAEFIEPPRVDGPAVWETRIEADGLTAVRQGSAPGEPAIVVARLLADSMAAPRPDWQFDQALAAELVPAWISGGLFMVVVGVGVVWMVRVRYPDPRRTDAGSAAAPTGADAGPTAPVPLSPAVARALRRRRAPDGRASLRATADDLAARGLLGANRAGHTDRPLLAHEQALTDEAWLAGRPAGARRKFRVALERDLVDAGLVDAERLSVARGLVGSGAAVVVMGAACAALIPWLLARFGVAIYAVPGGIVVLGLLLLVAGWRFVVLTPAGERARAVARQ